jgi:hypothetical protein
MWGRVSGNLKKVSSVMKIWSRPLLVRTKNIFGNDGSIAVLIKSRSSRLAGHTFFEMSLGVQKLV